jgi:hypothetical protein
VGLQARADTKPAAGEALDGALVGVFAGLLGAKLRYVAEHLDEEPWTSQLTNRAGLSWFGG